MPIGFEMAPEGRLARSRARKQMHGRPEGRVHSSGVAAGHKFYAPVTALSLSSFLSTTSTGATEGFGMGNSPWTCARPKWVPIC